MTTESSSDAATLPARARAHGDRPALDAPEGRYGYARLVAAADAVAERLLGGRSDLEEARVAFLVPPGFRWTALQWGIWRAGGIAVPLALSQPAREHAWVLDDAGPERVVADPVLAGGVAEAARARGLPLTTTDQIVPSGLPRGPTDAGLPRVEPSRRAMILYTSGTTGRPKGVVSTHASLEAQMASLAEAWGWRADDHTLLVLPLHHVHGIVNVLGCALRAGALCSVLPAFHAIETWERLGRGDLTVFMAVPTVYQRLLEAWDGAGDSERGRWSEGARRLRLAVSGSAALPVRVLERWEEVTGQRLLERYGMTEIGMALSNPLLGERRPGHVGLPLPGVEVRLVDEQARPVPRGVAGEIQVRGETVFREYWNRPEETGAAFAPGGWFRTGDVAVLEGGGEGSYRILGRLSVDIVKSGGEKVSALEVEETLREHPAIRDCAVVGVSDPRWGERVSAAVVLVPGGEAPSLEGLRDWARERLAPWKVPRALLVVEELPRNAMGKVTKPAVRALFGDG